MKVELIVLIFKESGTLSKIFISVQLAWWTGKSGTIGKHFPVGEKSGNFEQIGKMREFYPKYCKRVEILASFHFYFFSDF